MNSAVGFWNIFKDMTIILLIMGVFDRIFIDWYWVGKTKAWEIPGTEDLKPYISKKDAIRKWIVTVIGYPLMAATLAAIIGLFVK